MKEILVEKKDKGNWKDAKTQLGRDDTAECPQRNQK